MKIGIFAIHPTVLLVIGLLLAPQNINQEQKAHEHEAKKQESAKQQQRG